MDSLDPLRQAAVMVPRSATSEAGSTVADAIDYLDHNEYEVALDLLTELGEAYATETSYWNLLADAAAEMNLHRAKAWCHWRAAETVHGIIRADLRLVDPAQPGARRTAIPGDGILRPLWNVGLVMPEGHPDLRVARIWVERVPHLEPSACGPVRLAPLRPEGWRHLKPGHQITMHEQAPPAGTATITQATFPVAAFSRPGFRRSR
ncbi:hypothetical protein [Actinoplanes xinjiangensis]|uniref:Uncharacterized protein n=1 Tax=Actinoplanes xinjiangensis TaxID=512350 RepID=A0A316EM69_9ACTN|nr:hypothetical protein [Actinoplanes xinjiangensis]PWK32403.1 hypothetical protein BC793_13013 [Actinoplanes xinjiangensis]GIF44541.1 hypothetical protein Axi01nite_88520 [Actinoplanes xinjiangensis]